MPHVNLLQVLIGKSPFTFSTSQSADWAAAAEPYCDPDSQEPEFDMPDELYLKPSLRMLFCIF